MSPERKEDHADAQPSPQGPDPQTDDSGFSHAAPRDFRVRQDEDDRDDD